MQSDPQFIRTMIIKTVADVTGDDVPDVARRKRMKLDTRDWEQVSGRRRSRSRTPAGPT